MKTAQSFLSLVDMCSEALGVSVDPIVNLDELRSLPPGTFGRAWADHLDRHQLQPFTTGPRRKQIHDGIHVLTGYGIDPIGEAEVQAFLLGTQFHPANIVLMLSLLGVIRRSTGQSPQPSLSQVRDRLRQAYQRGCHASLNPDRWQPEHLWDQPLVTVQAVMNIAP